MGSKKENGTGGASGRWPRPENQEARKYRRDMEGKNPSNIKDIRKNKRRLEKQQLLDDQQLGMRLLPSRCKMQFYRALKHVFDGGTATPEDMDYIAGKGTVLERYTMPEGVEDPELPEVVITIVEFARTKSQKVA